MRGDPVKRCAESGDERDGGGVGGLAVLGVLALLAEVEVVARVVGGLHAIPGAIADGEVAEAGRNHDGLLRAADEDIDTPGVHVEVRGAEAGDGVDDEEGFGVGVLEQLGDGRDAVADAGRGLGGLHEDGAGFEVQRGLDFVEREGLAVGGADDVDVTAEGLADAGPALAELAGGEDQDAIAGRGEVGDRGLHGAGAGAGEQDDVVGGADELLELGEDAGVEGAKLGGAVMDVGRGHGELGGGKQGRWTGREESRLADHAFYFSGWRGMTNVRGFGWRLSLVRRGRVGETFSMTIHLIWKLLYWAWILTEVWVLLVTRTRRGGGEVHDRGSLIVLWFTIFGAMFVGSWVGAVYQPAMFHAGRWLRYVCLGLLAAGTGDSVERDRIRWAESFSANVAIHATQTAEPDRDCSGGCGIRRTRGSC